MESVVVLLGVELYVCGFELSIGRLPHNLNILQMKKLLKQLQQILNPNPQIQIRQRTLINILIFNRLYNFTTSPQQQTSTSQIMHNFGLITNFLLDFVQQCIELLFYLELFLFRAVDGDYCDLFVWLDETTVFLLEG